MNEIPVAPPSYQEIPVPEPNLFLLNRANRAFIERRTNNPVWDEAPPEQDANGVWGILLFIIGTLMSLTIVSNLPLGEYRVWIFLVALIGIIALSLTLFWAYYRYIYETLQLKGWILPGKVLHSEKIRMVADESWDERVRVRFQYSTPDGILTVGYAEGNSDWASDNMAPAPGTPIRVWYGDDGEIFLL
jgi:hypothetical protein